jgi:hypothetical protein
MAQTKKPTRRSRTDRRAPGDNQKHEPAERENGASGSGSRSASRKPDPHVGGQGMGQGRGMNPGEIHRDE